VRLTTQQRRSATGQVVETMEQLSDGLRHTDAALYEAKQSGRILVMSKPDR